MNIEAVRLTWSQDCNIIVGQSHFIKTIEDLAEILAGSGLGAKWGIAFIEASGPCLIRTEGNDQALIGDAVACARATGAGHSFYIVLGQGAYPIQVLDRVKACPEVCGIFCATANPLELIVARSEQGSAILGAVDGFSPKGLESEADKTERRAMLRRFGYKFG